MEAVLNSPIFLAMVYLLLGVLGFFAAGFIAKLNKTSDKQTEGAAILAALQAFTDKLEERGEKHEDRTAATREELRAVEVRVGAVEDVANKMADVLVRMARIEERMLADAPRLTEAHETARAVLKLGEQMKTAFNRIDDLATEVQGAPAATARELRKYLVKPHG